MGWYIFSQYPAVLRFYNKHCFNILNIVCAIIILKQFKEIFQRLFLLVFKCSLKIKILC